MNLLSADFVWGK